MSKSWKTLVAAVVMAGGVSSVAIADGYDYEYEPVGKSFAAPPVFAWTGWYAGMNAGWIRSESEARLTGVTGDFAAVPGLLPSKLSHDADGFIYAYSQRDPNGDRGHNHYEQDESGKHIQSTHGMPPRTIEPRGRACGDIKSLRQ